MTNICSTCGSYHADRSIDPAGPWAICPECGAREAFEMRPLFLVGGPSGGGKSAVARELLRRELPVVALDSDIIWDERFNTPENNYRPFTETWLRLAKNIGQSGRPCVIFGGGFAVPENVEPCVERRYFSNVHYLALVATDDVLTERLRTRPAFRKSSRPELIAEHLRFARWLRESGASLGIELVDTSTATPEETAGRVAEWIQSPG